MSMIKFMIFAIMVLIFLGYVYISWNNEKKVNESDGQSGTDHEKPINTENDKEQDDGRLAD